MGELTGRVALITGAAQGLGLAIAARFIAEDARVAMADLQSEKVTAAARRLDPQGRDAVGMVVDVTSAPSVAEMVEAAITRFGRLDLLVNAAGGSGTEVVGSIDDMTDEIWDSVIARNLRGTFLCCRAAVPHLRRSGGDARILNFSSGAVQGVAGTSTIFAPLAYAAAKGGIHGLTGQLAKDPAATGIAVNVLQSGFVLTEPGARVRDHFDRMSEAERGEMLRHLKAPPRQPDEVGWGVAYLMSARAKGLTGTTVRLTGKIAGLGLRLVPEGTSPFGPFARLEPGPG